MKRTNYKKAAMVLGVSCVLLLTVGVSYSKVMGKYNIGKECVTTSNNDYAVTAELILKGLGGRENITSIDNCITRIRLEVKDQSLVDEKLIKLAGVAGVIRPGKTSVQVIIGTHVQFVADEFKKLCG